MKQRLHLNNDFVSNIVKQRLCTEHRFHYIHTWIMFTLTLFQHGSHFHMDYGYNIDFISTSTRVEHRLSLNFNSLLTIIMFLTTVEYSYLNSFQTILNYIPHDIQIYFKSLWISSLPANHATGVTFGSLGDWSKTSMTTSGMEVSGGPMRVNIPWDGQEGVAMCNEEEEELDEAELMAYL
ncbi:hypothetical protein Taro_056917 [Colocasia esculenta]|uniref:Uncharacterized protein n=1 Tax=Colocasia esculenta TaxID=4460 RepID=A0A843XUN8_COLES|nr:hypothetical protein [Colocasia esculenta]